MDKIKLKYFNNLNNPKFVLSPIGLLTLAACGGGGGGGGGTNSTPLSVTVSGNAVAGPIDGAVAFVDYNENGILDASDEPYVYTDGNGAFSLTSTDFDAPIVVTTDSTTAGGLSVNAIDGSSSTSLSGLTLKAPTGSTVVSPTSTVAYDLIKTNGLTEAQVATALGLDGVSILSFNPYAAGVDADTALAVEKVASQVMTTVKTIAAAAEGSGANAEDAANQAFDSIVTVLQSKASSSETLNFANTTDLTSVETQAKSKLASLSGIDTSSFNTILDTAMDSVKLVNDVINNITDTDLTSNANKGVFAAADHLKTQTKTAATAEKATPGSGNQHITMNDADAVNTAVNSATSNVAPTDISLSKTSIAENSSSLTFTATTTDDSSSSFTYSLSGSDASYFTLNSSTGVLTLKASPNYETKSSYSITIKTSDDADVPKSYKEDFTINVTDVNEAPSFSSSSGTGSVAENADASTVIYTASASDPDTTDSIIYSISGGDDASLVQIDSSTGKVTLRDPADKETNPSIDFIVKASDASDSTLSTTQSVSVTVTEKNELPSASSKTITLVENVTKTFSSSDFGFSDPDGDSLTKIKIMAVHESDEGQLKLSGNIVAAGDEISLSDLSSLTYTPGIDEIGDAYARISFKVNDGNNYSESAKHVYINVEEAALTSSSSLALKASSGSSGQNYRLLGESTGSVEVDNLMTGSGWAKSNGDYGASSDIYLTYSFYQSGSTYSYISNEENELISISSTGQESIRSVLSQIEKFTNLNFVEVNDTASTFGDIRITEAKESLLGVGVAGLGFFPGYGSLLDTDNYNDLGGDVFLASSNDTEYSTQGSFSNYLIMHEIGHALGLAHPFHAGNMNPEIHNHDCACESCSHNNEFVFGSNTTQGSSERDSSVYSVMSYGFTSNGYGRMINSDPSSSTYMVDDVRALQVLYGVDKSFSAGNNIYDYSMFSSDDSGFIKSIYDYSGTDTIDFSNQLFQTRGTLNTNDYLFIDGNSANGTITSTSDNDILNLTKFEGVLGMANSYVEQFFGGGGSDEITAGSSGSILFGGFSSNTTDAITAGSGNDNILLYDHGFIASKTECDTVKSFDTSNDKIGLEFGLTFSDLSFEDSGSDCYIKNASGSYLMKLEGVSSSSLTESVFSSTAYLEKSLGVLENNAPVILSGSTLKVSIDSKIVGYVNSSDVDNDRLFYRLAETGDYNSVSINSSTGLITLSNTLGNAETKKITVEVSDGIAKTSKIFTIEGTTDSGVVSVLDREIEVNDTLVQANSITLDKSIKGKTSSSSDSDYFKFTTEAAGTLGLSFTSESAEGLSHEVSLLNSSGVILSKAFINGNDNLSAEVSEAGSYYILINNSLDNNNYEIKATYNSTTGARETEANDTIATAYAITSGTTIIGQTSSKSDDDYYKLAVSAAGTISVTFNDGDGSTVQSHNVSIVDASGNVLGKEVILDSGSLSSKIGTAGNYYVLIDNSLDTKDYSLTATFSETSTSREAEPNNSIATADNISSGVAISGQTASYSDDDYYKLALSAAGTISVSFTGDSSNYSYHSVSILDENGKVLTSDRLNGSGSLNTEVSSSGNYYVLVDNSFDTEDYSLTATYSSTTGARETEANDTIATADTITSGTAIAGQASSSTDDDYYKIALSAAGTISVAFNDGDGSNYRGHDVSIVDANGNVLAKESIYETGTVSTEVGSSGNYYVLVDGSYDTKDYSLTATYSSTTGARETEANDTIATADTITSGTAIAGQASSSTDDDYYKIALSAAGTISVAFNDGDGSTYLDHDVSIVDANGNVLAKESIYETGTVSTEVGSSGNYYVLVDGSYDTEDYSLTATYSSTTGARETEANDTIATADTITSGTAIAGQASSSTDDDYYKIALSAAGTISVAFNDGDGSTYLDHDVSIVDANGNVLAKESIYETGTVSTEVGSSGNYYVLVDGSYDTKDYSLTATYSSTTGARETEANDTIATADTITSGTAIAGQASSSTDDDYYKIALSAAGTISVAFNDGDGSTYLDHDVSIVDANGNVLAKESIYETGTVSTEVGSSGNYYVLVDGSYDTEDYSLTATYSSTTGARETEANDTIATADTITSGTAIAGQTSSSSDDDYYKIALSAAGTISVAFNDGDGSAYLDHDVSIIDASGNIMAKKSIYENGTVTAEVGSSGNYYVLVDGSYDTEDYSLTATYSSTTGARETEDNSVYADLITSGTSISGQNSSSSDKDWYYMPLSSSGTISVAFNDGDGSAYLDHDVSIIDASGNIMAKKSIYENGTVTAEVGSSGNYFVLIDGSYDTEDYNLTATLNSTTGVRETENNNSIATADNIVAGTSITGQSSSSYDKDYFKADISGASTARFSFTSDSSDYSSHTVIVYNSSGSVITSERVNGNTSVDITFSEATTIYGLVGNSYDTEDYSISYQIV